MIDLNKLPKKLKYKVINNTFTQKPKNNPKDLIEIEVGDIKQPNKFIPQLKIKRWDNEVNFSIRHKDNDNTIPVVEVVDNIIKYKKTKTEVHLYNKPEASNEGGYELEVILNEKPINNVVEFTIETKGLEFFYQPELTQEEIDDGYQRPDNIIGSYAVYYKDHPINRIDGKEYKTGKAFHIFRPKIIDANGDWVWGELNIDVNKKLATVTVPQEFLDTKQYPIIVDPTFGYTTVASSTRTAWLNRMYGDSGTSDIADGGGSVDSVTAYLTSFGSGELLKGVIVNDSETILTNGVSDEFTSTGTSGWNTATYSTSPSVGDGRYYACFVISPGAVVAYDSSGGRTDQSIYDSTNNYATPQNPTGATVGTVIYSIYATYTAGGGSSPSSSPSLSPSSSPSSSPSLSPSSSTSLSPSSSPSASPSPSSSDSPSISLSPSLSPSSSISLSPSPSPSSSESRSPSNSISLSPSSSPSLSPSPSSSISLSPSSSISLSPSPSSSESPSPSSSSSASPSPSSSDSPSISLSPSVSESASISLSPSASQSPSSSDSPSISLSPSSSQSPSSSESPSPSASISQSPSSSESLSISLSPSASPSSSQSPSSSESLSPSSSASLSPSASQSPSSSDSPSPSSSPSVSISSSISLSPSSSISSSPSPSASLQTLATDYWEVTFDGSSPSASISLSQSLSPSNSVSLSPSPSSSPSLSPSSSSSLSPSLSPSATPSSSPSSSPSLSPSPSSSISPSQEPGQGLYSYQALDSLPLTSDELAIPYGAEDDIAVATDDGSRVPVTGDQAYLAHEFKRINNTNKDSATITVNLQTTLDPTTQTVYLQVWNNTTELWETIDSDSTSLVNTDFDLTYTISSNQTDYYDSEYTITYRVYQATGLTTQSLSIDLVHICFVIVYASTYSDQGTSYSDKYTTQGTTYSDKYTSQGTTYVTNYTKKKC